MLLDGLVRGGNLCVVCLVVDNIILYFIGVVKVIGLVIFEL